MMDAKKKSAPKKAAAAPAAAKQKPQKKAAPARIVTKQVVADKKNGSARKTRVSRLSRYYPTEDRPKKIRSRKIAFKNHKHQLRASITPGTVLILLVGRHKGKRVVFLKQLSSGLLLVTGPYHLNGCPLRRVNPIYVIATKTRLDVSGVKVPEHINDAYFRRLKLKKPKHAEGEIFDTKKEVYKVSEQRKTDQVDVDKQVLGVVRQSKEKKFLFGYLGALFGLKTKEYPHKMAF